MVRLHEICREREGNVTYSSVKKILVSEFGAKTFGEHKTTVRWDLEHMAQYVTSEVDPSLALDILKKTRSDRTMNRINSRKQMVSSSLRSTTKSVKHLKSKSQLNLLKAMERERGEEEERRGRGGQGAKSAKGTKSANGAGGGDDCDEAPLVMGLPPWKMRGTCVEGKKC
jgi:hypothetical protein